MSLPRDLVAGVRRLDEYQLRRLQILVRGLLLHADGPPGEDDADPLVPVARYRQEHVRCGKPRCRRCPHGPYWYAYYREGGRTRRQYVGRYLPGEPLEPVVPGGEVVTAETAARSDEATRSRGAGAE